MRLQESIIPLGACYIVHTIPDNFSWRQEKSSGIGINTYLVCETSSTQEMGRGATLSRNRNCVRTTVLVCEQNERAKVIQYGMNI